MAAMFNPGLTTVSVPKKQCGRAAVELLLKLLNEPGIRMPRREVPMQLLVRDTTTVAQRSP